MKDAAMMAVTVVELASTQNNVKNVRVMKKEGIQQVTFLVSYFTCRRLLGHAEPVANQTVQTSHLIMHLPRLFLSLELRNSLHNSVLFIILGVRTKLIVTVWCYCPFGTYAFQTITPLYLLENVLLILVDHLTLSCENLLCARVEVGLILA